MPRIVGLTPGYAGVATSVLVAGWSWLTLARA